MTNSTGIRTDDVVLSRNETVAGDRARFYAAVRKKELVRLTTGAYLPADLWAALDSDAQHRALLVATQAVARRELVFSHSSAAALWRLPRIGPWPPIAEVTVPFSSGGRSTRAMRAHAVGRVDATECIDGLRVTTLERTTIDQIAKLPFAPAVALADAALRRNDHPVPGLPPAGASLESLRAELEQLPPNQGQARARRALDFARAEADRPGESLSRVTMHLAGITPPELQVALFGASGRRYVVDFWWPEYRVFGEFDGEFKYSDPEFLRGRTPHQALVDEKFREDDLRALDRGCARWGWKTARSVPQLRGRLALAGVR